MKTLITMLLLIAPAFAQSDPFCRYTAEQAMAQRDILRTPSAISGFVQPAGVAPELVGGVTSSISGIKQSVLTMQAATTTCALYRATVEAQQAILYAIPSLEHDAVLYHALLVQRATAQLDAMADESDKMVQAQNLTKPNAYYLQQAKVGLEMTVAVPPHIPTLSTTPLKVLIGDKLADEERNQKALARLAKQTSWDVSLNTGVHRQIGQATAGSSETGMYGTFSVSYNLARKAANRHVDKAVAAYTAWKATQVDDVAHEAVLLKEQIEVTVDTQQGQLLGLLAHAEQTAKDIKALEGVDTSNALMFRNQLRADTIVLNVEIEDLKFRLDKQQRFLTENY